MATYILEYLSTAIDECFFSETFELLIKNYFLKYFNVARLLSCLTCEALRLLNEDCNTNNFISHPDALHLMYSNRRFRCLCRRRSEWILSIHFITRRQTYVNLIFKFCWKLYNFHHGVKIKPNYRKIEYHCCTLFKIHSISEFI